MDKHIQIVSESSSSLPIISPKREATIIEQISIPNIVFLQFDWNNDVMASLAIGMPLEDIDGSPLTLLHNGTIYVLYNEVEQLQDFTFSFPVVATNAEGGVIPVNLTNVGTEAHVINGKRGNGNPYNPNVLPFFPSRQVDMKDGIAIIPITLFPSNQNIRPSNELLKLYFGNITYDAPSHAQKDAGSHDRQGSVTPVRLGVGLAASVIAAAAGTAAYQEWCRQNGCSDDWASYLEYAIERGIVTLPEIETPVIDYQECDEGLITLNISYLPAGTPAVKPIVVVPITTTYQQQCLPKPEFTAQGSQPQFERTVTSDPYPSGKRNHRVQNAIKERWLQEADLFCRFGKGTYDGFSDVHKKALKEAGEAWRGGAGSKRRAINILRRAGVYGSIKPHVFAKRVYSEYVMQHINAFQCFPSLGQTLTNLTIIRRSDHVPICHNGNTQNCSQGDLAKDMVDIIADFQSQGIDNIAQCR